MLGLLGALISGGFKAYEAKKRQNIVKIQEQTRLIRDKDANNTAWEIASLTTSGRSLKWASFCLFALPIVMTVIGPFIGLTQQVDEMWQAFEMVPEGWLQVYFMITGGIWGISALKDAGASLQGTVDAFIRGKNQNGTTINPAAGSGAKTRRIKRQGPDKVDMTGAP